MTLFARLFQSAKMLDATIYSTDQSLPCRSFEKNIEEQMSDYYFCFSPGCSHLLSLFAGVIFNLCRTLKAFKVSAGIQTAFALHIEETYNDLNACLHTKKSFSRCMPSVHVFPCS